MHLDLDEWDRHLYQAKRHRDAVLAKLRPEREARGLSVREVARRAHISPAALSEAERGEGTLCVSTVRRLVAVLSGAARRARGGEGE